MAYPIGFVRCWENNKKVVNHLPLARDFSNYSHVLPSSCVGHQLKKRFIA